MNSQPINLGIQFEHRASLRFNKAAKNGSSFGENLTIVASLFRGNVTRKTRYSAILEIASSGISNPIGKRADLFDYLPRRESTLIAPSVDSGDSLLFLSRAPDCAISSGKSSGSARRDRRFDAAGIPPFSVLMFTIYHSTPDCLPDDKGSYI